MQLPPLSASVGGVQGLMNIANEVNEERQIAVAAPFVATTLFEAFGVFVNFRCNAGSSRASRRQIAPAVPQNRCR
jgi:hypothetical protein